MTSEFDGFTVHEDTSVGWDEKALPNETVDENGDFLEVDALNFAAADPIAPPRRVYDDDSVEALRERLRKHNGVQGLEICSPDEVERAARIFHRDGFVVVRDLLTEEQLERSREGCARVLKEILSVPGPGERKYMAEHRRLPHRYSYGTTSASRQMLHDEAWTHLIDLSTTTPIVTEIFGSSDYAVWGSGGDLSLPGSIEYQRIHSDSWDAQLVSEARVKCAENLGVELNSDNLDELDVPTSKMIMEMTAPMVTINFVMSDLTWENGPIRQIPGSHTAQQFPPKPGDEPDWMKNWALVGAPAGAGVFRDNRAWHSATPNLSRQVRALPNMEYLAPWANKERIQQTMPHEVWETLTPFAQHLCRYCKAEKGVWPAGAGLSHPLPSGRKALIQSG